MNTWKGKHVNDSLPHHLHQKLPTINDLQLPHFESGAIGCLHEATETYLLSMLLTIKYESFRFFDFILLIIMIIN